MSDVRETHREITVTQRLTETHVECDCGWSATLAASWAGVEGSAIRASMQAEDVRLARKAWADHRCEPGDPLEGPRDAAAALVRSLSEVTDLAILAQRHWSLAQTQRAERALRELAALRAEILPGFEGTGGF